MFTHRTTSRTDKRYGARRIRGILEQLESRKLMAGDLNMGAYVINSNVPVSDPPPAYEQPIQPAATAATVVLPQADRGSLSDVDAALTGSDSWLPSGFIPSCPSNKLSNVASEKTFVENGGAEASLTEDVKPLATPQALGNTGAQGPRDRIASRTRAASETCGTLPLSSVGTGPQCFLKISDATGPAFQAKVAADDFHYFATDGDQHPIDGPSLVDQSLLEHVQTDTFMAMALLPATQSSREEDASKLASQSESGTRREDVPGFAADIDALDLSSLRESALVAESSGISFSVTFLAAARESISAAVACVMSMDCFSGSQDNGDASLVAKLNENRYQFAAFAFVFTVVTLRMNCTESEPENSHRDAEQEASRKST